MVCKLKMVFRDKRRERERERERGREKLISRIIVRLKSDIDGMREKERALYLRR